MLTSLLGLTLASVACTVSVMRLYPLSLCRFRRGSFLTRFGHRILTPTDSSFLQRCFATDFDYSGSLLRFQRILPDCFLASGVVSHYYLQSVQSVEDVVTFVCSCGASCCSRVLLILLVASIASCCRRRHSSSSLRRFLRCLALVDRFLAIHLLLTGFLSGNPIGLIVRLQRTSGIV